MKPTLVAATSSLCYLLRMFSNLSRKELLDLPGLGPGRVEKIMQVRSDTGNLRMLKDLMGIPGIGPSLLTKTPGGHPHSQKVAECVLCYEDKYKCIQQGHPQTVLSIDLGVKNSSFCLVDYEECRVIQWERVNLELPKPYSAEECYRKVKKNLDQLPSADLYLIEEQSHRNPNQGFLGISIQMRTLEAMVHAILNQRDWSCVRVRSIPARRVGKYFGIGGENKKKEAIKTVSELMNSSCHTPMGIQVDIPKQLVEYFKGEKKKDDMSDCFLQALAVLEWRTMTLQLENN